MSEIERISPRYKVIRELGSGGMGTVYLVSDRFRADQQVALKTIHPHRLKHLDKFRQEFTVLTKLRHPNLIKVFDFGSTPPPDARFYFTSEYFEGQPLDQWVAGLDILTLMRVMLQITEVIQHLHLRGVLHLDVKPDNILVRDGKDGKPAEARLIDLGLARFRQENRNELSGTIYYMAPEQIRRHQLDGRADCWAIGVVLYQCLFHQLPFLGDSIPEVIDKILKQPVTFPEQSAVPERVTALLTQLLAKDPAKRISSAATLLKSLGDLYTDLSPEQGLPAQPLRPVFYNRDHFVGRRTEFAALQNALPKNLEAQKGEAADLPFNWEPESAPPLSVVISGDEGVGKSRLVAELKAFAQLDHIDVFGGEHLAGQHGMLRQIIREVALTYGETEMIQSRHGALAKRLLTGAEAGESHFEEEWLNREIAEFLLDVASRKPILLWLDEPLAEDSETRNQLTFLTRFVHNQLVRNRFATAPLLVVLTVTRAESWIGQLNEIKNDLINFGSGNSTPLSLHFALEPWNPAEIHRYLETTLPELEITLPFSEAIHRSTQGNARLVRELCSALIQQGKLRADTIPGPQALEDFPLSITVQELMTTRWNALTDHSRELLTAITLAVLPLDESRLRAIAGGEPEELNRSLASLLDWGLIVPESDRYRAASPILTPLVASLVEAEQRRELHHRLADALIALAAVTPSGPALVSLEGAIATHLHRAGQTSEALPYALRASRALRDAHQVERAIPLYRIACQGSDESTVTIELARLLHRAGKHEEALDRLAARDDDPEVQMAIGLIDQKNADYDAAVGRFEKALAMISGAEQPRLALQLHTALAETRIYTGDYDQAMVHCTHGDALRDRVIERPPVGALYHKRGLVHYFKGEAAAARQNFGEALNMLAGNAQAVLLPSILNALGLLDHEAEKLNSALEYYQRAYQAAKQVGQLQREITISMNIGTIHTETEHFGDALEAFRSSLSRAEDMGNSWEIAKIANNLALLFHLFGHNERATRYARVSLTIAEEKGIPPLMAYNHSVMIDIASDTGDRQHAETHLHRLFNLTRDSNDRYINLDRLLARAKVALINEEYQQVLSIIAEMEQGEEQNGIELLQLIGEVLRGQALVELNRASEARDLLKKTLGLAERLGRLQYLWQVHYNLGRAEQQLNNRTAGDGHSTKARGILLQLQERLPEEFRIHFFKPVARKNAWTNLARSTPRTQSFHAEEDMEGAFLNYRQFKRFMEINNRLNSEHNTSKLLELIMDTVIELTGAERGFLIRLDGKKMKIPVARNIDQETIKRQQFKISRSIAEKVLESGEPLLSVDAQSDERLEDFSSVHQLRLRSILCLPLRIRSAVKGAIYIDNRFQYKAFNERDLMVLSAFGDQAGIAIHNAELMEANIKKQAQLEQAMGQVEELNRQLTETVELKSQKLDEITTILSSHAQNIKESSTFHNIISKNSRMQEVFRVVGRVAELDIPVYVYGESGTGKELVAKAIHFAASRPIDKFISVNCGSIPENLLESELFGHVKGSFTGAYYDKKGLFTLANDGTLFLDEIGDMPLNMQVKLLRVLQDKRFRPVGGTRELTTNARIISASNKNLLKLVNDGQFRQDLFFRLNVVQVDLPPLRERREDIPLLIQKFMKNESAGAEKKISKDVLKALTLYDWPGNVRELENEVSRMVALSGDVILVSDLSPNLSGVSRSRQGSMATVVQDGNMKQTIQTMEKEMLARTLRECKGSITKTANSLGLSRMGVYKKMAKFGLSRDMFRK